MGTWGCIEAFREMMDQVSGGVGVHRGLQGDDGPSEWGRGGTSRPSGR